VTLPALLLSAGVSAARRSQLSVAISCRQDSQQQTRLPPLLLSIDGTAKGTDGRTDGRPTIT